MSSDGADAVTGVGEAAKGLVPKLRFPEFRDAGGWKKTTLGSCASFKSGGTPSKDNPDYWNGSIPWVSASSMYDIIITTADRHVSPLAIGNGTRIAKKGSILILVRGSMLFRYVPVCLAAIDVAFNQDIKALTVSTSINTNFLLYQIIFSQSRILINATGIGAGKIESDHLSGFEVSIPQYTEQKKIADCLSSLYAVIAAEKERLATLRTHKKGLMQALSRALGHTIPRLRFPEFQDAGDWKEREVGDVFTVTRGNVLAMPLVDDLPTERKPYPVYSSQTKRNGLAGYYSAYLYENAITWTTDGANAGEVNYRAGKFYCTNVCGVLISEEGYANPCVAEIINNVSRDYVSYVGNPKLMNGVMARIVVAIPSVEEQQKLSEFLASVNSMISASANKIETLKAHKSGLMQQLFPSPTAAAT